MSGEGQGAHRTELSPPSVSGGFGWISWFMLLALVVMTCENRYAVRDIQEALEKR